MNQLLRYDIRTDLIRVGAGEILSVLGDSGASEGFLQKTVEDVITVASRICEFKGGVLVSDRIGFDNDRKEIMAEDISFSVGSVIYQHLNDSEIFALFACTAGDAIYGESRSQIDQGEYLIGYIFDIYGSIAVEKAVDHIHSDLKERYHTKGMGVSNRYSPGYCGWSVEEQRKLFTLLPESLCGITINNSCLMNPIKSVSGIMGIGKDIIFKEYTCKRCEAAHCRYRDLKTKHLV